MKNKMKKIILLFVSFLISLSSFAQANNNEFTVKKGYKGSVELGFAAGAGEVAHNRGELLIVNGYQLNKRFSVGLGTGIQFWQVTQQVTLPVFADFEATFMQTTISPYADLRLGYCWALSKDEILPKEGIYFSPTIGFRWGINQNSALKLGVGYLVQGSEITRNFSTLNAFVETIYFHSLVAKVAFEF